MLLLLKFIDEKDLETMQDGKIRFKKVGDFIDLEKKQLKKGIGDLDEGVWKRNVNKQTDTISIVDNGGNNILLDYNKATIRQTYKGMRDLPISCFTLLDIKKDFYYNDKNECIVNPEVINNLIQEQFGKRKVIMINFEQFMNRLERALIKEGYNYQAEKIKYYDGNHPLDIEQYNKNPFQSLFYKKSFFESQKEYRIAIADKIEQKTLDIDIGDIRDITAKTHPDDLTSLMAEF